MAGLNSLLEEGTLPPLPPTRWLLRGPEGRRWWRIGLAQLCGVP